MKLKELVFRGYRRLSSAKCNVEGRTISFIGPNEAGKSSILTGLDWLTSSTEDVPLPPGDYNRKTPPTGNQSVVLAKYRLEPDDYLEIGKLDIDTDSAIDLTSLTEFLYARSLAGTIQTGLTSTLQRNPAPIVLLAKGAAAGATALERVKDKVDPEALESVLADLTKLIEIDPKSPDVDELKAVRAALLEPDNSVRIDAPTNAAQRRSNELLEQLGPKLDLAIEAAGKKDPQIAIRNLLKTRVPKFVLFTDSDRMLAAAYHLGDEGTRSNPPAPLLNLLSVAGTAVGELWAVFGTGVVADLRTLQRRANDTLKSRLQPMWTQSKLTIELALNPGGVIEVNINELESPDFTVTPIAERSDGLRAFLALVCFLVAADLPVPPVLMVDEAERNLHYDAQADLVRVLTKDLRVNKVIYTTHSPGCLPLDLGTGIRVVSRDPNDTSASTLENNFWTDTEPGFSRLLFAMGAEVAAFSAFRRAVLAEGVSEMILLPTLMRNATGGAELDFQVAFGLSNMSAPGALGAVALITTFLVDGDDSGDTKRADLELAGFPKTHIFALPKGKAIEDLVDQATYLDEVDGFLLERNGVRLNRSALAKNVTIARAVDDYCKGDASIGRDVSHKIIAFRLAERAEELKLSPLGARVLPELRKKIEAALETPYNLASTAAES